MLLALPSTGQEEQDARGHEGSKQQPHRQRLVEVGGCAHRFRQEGHHTHRENEETGARGRNRPATPAGAQMATTITSESGP